MAGKRKLPGEFDLTARYFAPLAKTIVRKTDGWQVWAVERRENLLEDHSVLNRAKRDRANGQELFDYYLGFLADSSISPHFELIPDTEVGFAREWGMRVEIEDLRRVVKRAERRGRRVVVGGHSLGGSITTAYATWDFGGRPGARGLSGLVYIDGGSSPAPVSADQARQSLETLANGSPWLTFGGIAAPFTGLFNSTGSLGVIVDPDAPSRGQAFPLLPANLKPPVPASNVAQYGYALDTETSPPGLVAAQAHLGRLAASGEPRGWERAGELTPIRRYATMFSGWGLRGLDGTAWYHPQRLTIDSGAVAAGNPNPAQDVLDVRATHGDDLPKRLRIYAFGASLGGDRVLEAARILAELEFKRFSAVPSRAYPGIEDYLGMDRATGTLVHLHVHYRLTLGERYIKGYRLPWEEEVTGTDGTGFGFPKPVRLYGERRAAFRRFGLERSEGGEPAEAVAEVVEEALTSPRPKARYLVGRDARLRAGVERLPSRLRDRVYNRVLLGGT